MSHFLPPLRWARWFAVMICGLGLACRLGAADPLPTARPGQAETPPLPSQAPIEYFRSLLQMSQEQRALALSQKAPGQREVLESKIREYGAMSERERELRLRLLQIRLYMIPLFRMSEDDRASMLERIPERDRGFVAARLNDWNRLSPAEQALLLAHPRSLHYFIYRGFAGSGLDAEQMSKIMPPAQQEQRERMIARWQALPERHRLQVTRTFDRFLALESAKRKAVLARLPIPDRAHAERTVQRLQQLSAEERDRFVAGLKKFAQLDTPARRRFLLQAQQWQRLSPEERNLWRSIVAKVEAPFPPDPPGSAGPRP